MTNIEGENYLDNVLLYSLERKQTRECTVFCRKEANKYFIV